MKISLNWVRRYVDVDWDAEEIARRLTLSGTEVESVDRLEAGFTHVVVGQVVECGQHPNADRLQVTKIDIGDGSPRPVVCGAANCRLGLKVAFAMVGAELPGDFKIEARPVRGETSLGMLCAQEELGLAESSEGIWELDPQLPVGAKLVDVLPIEDTILDVGVTANRGDCLSHIGIAREIAALAGTTVRLPEAAFPTADGGEPVPVSIDAPARCARYVGRVVRGLKVGPSPFWMQRLLLAVGVRPISNIVDVTNFVLFEYGQPLHAFDLAQLAGPAITVRMAAESEIISTLDGQQRTVGTEDLLICDADGPVALAGIMGGGSSEVSDATTDVLLESAWFEPAGIRLSSRRIGLRSESSHRFERSVDPESTLAVADRALHLLCALSAGESAPVVDAAYTDTQARPVPRSCVEYQVAQADRLLGFKVSDSTQREALTRFGFTVEGDTQWTVTAPSWRRDVVGPADLIEEIARYIGYDAVPTPTPRVTASAGDDAGHARDRRLRKVRAFLTGQGVNQALNFSFLGKKALALFDDRAPLELLNPLSEEQRALRLLLAPQLVANARHNLRHGEKTVALFEIGKIFEPAATGVQPIERERLGIVLAGDRFPHWSGPSKPFDFFDLKGMVESLGALMGHPIDTATIADRSWLHPGACATLSANGVELGVVGVLHPRLARSLDLTVPVLIAELELDAFVGAAPTLIPFVDFSRQPAISRDVALRLSRTVSSAQVLSSIEEMGIELVDKLRVFDVYEGGNLSADERSLGISVTYRAPGRTLTDDEVLSVHTRVVEHLRATFGAAQR